MFKKVATKKKRKERCSVSDIFIVDVIMKIEIHLTLSLIAGNVLLLQLLLYVDLTAIKL